MKIVSARLSSEQLQAIESVMRKVIQQNGAEYYFGRHGTGFRELAEDTAYLLSVPDEDGKSLYVVPMPADLFSDGAGTYSELYEMADLLSAEIITIMPPEADSKALTEREAMLVAELIMLVREQWQFPASKIDTLQYRDEQYPGLEAQISIQVVQIEEAAS